VAKEEMIGQGGKRCTLAAGCDIARPKIADRCDAGAFRDDSGHSESQRRGEPAIGIVPDGVSGTTDTLDALEAEAGTIGDLPGGCSKRLSQQPMEKTDVTCLCLDSATRHAFEQISQVRRVGLLQYLQGMSLEIEADALKFQENSIDAIGAGA
jgi:hypothetical protein